MRYRGNKQLCDVLKLRFSRPASGAAPAVADFESDGLVHATMTRHLIVLLAGTWPTPGPRLVACKPTADCVPAAVR